MQHDSKPTLTTSNREELQSALWAGLERADAVVHTCILAVGRWTFASFLVGMSMVVAIFLTATLSLPSPRVTGCSKVGNGAIQTMAMHRSA